MPPASASAGSQSSLSHLWKGMGKAFEEFKVSGRGSLECLLGHKRLGLFSVP